MVRNKVGLHPQKIIWRISQEHPEGAYFKVADRKFLNAGLPEPPERSFVVSSLDLLQGTEVTETFIDALPNDVTAAFESLFGPR